MTVARHGVSLENSNVTVLKIWEDLFEKSGQRTVIVTHPKTIPQLLHNFPLTLRQFIVPKLQRAFAGELVDGVTICVGEFQHIISRVPPRPDVTRHHANRKFGV